MWQILTKVQFEKLTCAHKRFLILETWLILTNEVAWVVCPHCWKRQALFLLSAVCEIIQLKPKGDKVALTWIKCMCLWNVCVPQETKVIKSRYIIRCVYVWVDVLPGIGRWGLPVAAGSLSASDIPSQTSSAFWLEPENNRKVVFFWFYCKLPDKISAYPSCCE